MATSTPHPADRRRRGILIIAFAVYLALLTWVVLWKLEVPWVGDAAGLARPIKLVPFAPSADAGASTPAELLINVVLFVPFGLFVGALAPVRRWWTTVIAASAASLILETTQHLLSTGSFDTTDLITNTLGALLGWALFLVVRAKAGARTPVVMLRVCVIVSVLALIAAIGFFVSPLNYGPQRDVVVERSMAEESSANGVMDRALVRLTCTEGASLAATPLAARSSTWAGVDTGKRSASARFAGRSVSEA